MKKILSLLIVVLITILVGLNIDTITNYLANFIQNDKKVTIQSANKYKKEYSFRFVQITNDFVPYSYQDLLNIIYSTLNNGWDTFTFYCPNEYTNCLNDLNKISQDKTLLSNINNYVHPYNSFSKIGFVSSTTGEVTINVTKLYSDDDIRKINTGVDQILTENVTQDMNVEDKILKIHDFIVNNTKYDVDKVNEASYTAMGPLFYGTAVCSGYSDLMELFLIKFNLRNFKVASNTHVWNAVYLNGEWLNIDLTWDDPVIKGTNADTLQHDFFLINTQKLLEFDIKDHTFDSTVYRELN